MNMKKSLRWLFYTVLPFALLCSLSNTLIATNTVYQWVDAQGNTHYTQTKPPAEIAETDITVKTIASPAQHTDDISKTLGGYAKDITTATEERAKKAAEIKEKQQQQEESKARCEQSKARVTSYQRARIRVKEENGDSRIIGEQERQTEIQKSNDSVKEHCD